MKKAITTIGVFGVICSAVLSFESAYKIAPPFATSRGILLRSAYISRLEKRTESELFSEIQIEKIEEALHEGSLLYESEKKLLKSQARYARYSLFFMAIACLLVGLTQSRKNVEKSIGVERKNEI